MTEDLERELRGLLDRQAITEVLMRYSRAIDRRDPDALLREVYWLDATDDHMLYQGDVPGMIDFAFGFTTDMPTMHFLGNIIIDLESDTLAFAETYHIAHHDMPAEDAGARRNLTLFGRYLDRFEKRDGIWRIKDRTVAIDCYTDAPGSSDWAKGMFAHVKTRGSAKPDDPLYRLHPRGAAI